MENRENLSDIATCVVKETEWVIKRQNDWDAGWYAFGPCTWCKWRDLQAAVAFLREKYPNYRFITSGFWLWRWIRVVPAEYEHMVREEMDR